MVISEKQQAANRQNAQHSTGPKTPEGKAASRFNALTWSLRARSLIIPADDPEEYQRLWDDLNAEWQPQTGTERHFLEQMAISKWLLVRTANSETRILRACLALGLELELLDRVDGQRTRLERAFTAGMHELERLQQKRQARPPSEPIQTTQTGHAAPAPPAPQPDYVMSAQQDTRQDGQQAHPVFCVPASPDTR